MYATGQPENLIEGRRYLFDEWILSETPARVTEGLYLPIAENTSSRFFTFFVFAREL